MKDRNNSLLSTGDLISLTPDPRYNLVSDIRCVYVGSTLTVRPNKYKVEYIPLTEIGVNTSLESISSTASDYFSKSKWYSLYTDPKKVLKISANVLTGKEKTNYEQIKVYLGV